ncbi:spore germination protein GerW family protein [Nonomuraea sp. NPDC050663]|uniref:Putative spore protein YtfJ n=1 Tax=Nonomuraea soli TaxID=1032476 RepID=A0A7W0CS48_9ACTN|nr:spore germination protein GerW family protein [Nonomuraea soli]MBA2896314.1 putative spore protein YtfJ [Nonomuraea soli]
MNIMELLDQTTDAATVGRVFGQPVTHDDVTIIPVARVAQAGGGGTGKGSIDEPGGGGGYAVAAKPAGVYVIKDGEVFWKPAVDVNRIVVGGQLVMVVLLMTLRAIFRKRRK